MRLIDADALDDVVQDLNENKDYGITRGEYKLIDAVLFEFPTIEERKWIPCSERLPEEKDAGILKKFGTNKRSDYVIATVEVKGERMTAIACTYDGAWDWNMKYAFPDFKVVAWMPSPEPYQEGENE